MVLWIFEGRNFFWLTWYVVWVFILVRWIVAPCLKCNHSSSKYKYLLSSQVKSGVKRKKADTTTPSSTVNDIPPSPVTPIQIAVPYLSGKIRSRRESHRSIKKPNKDLPGEDLAKVSWFFIIPLKMIHKNINLLKISICCCEQWQTFCPILRDQSYLFHQKAFDYFDCSQTKQVCSSQH